MDQNRMKSLQQKVVRPIRVLEAESQTGNLSQHGFQVPADTKGDTEAVEGNAVARVIKRYLSI
jgi:hypothetical protein